MISFRTIALCTAVALLAPTHAAAQSAYVESIVEQIDQGDTAAARQQVVSRIRAGDVSAEEAQAVARALARADANNDAIFVLDAALDRYPEEHRFHYVIGYLHQQMDREGDAILAFRRYLRAVEDDPDGLFALAESYASAGRTDEAIATYERYLEVARGDDEARRRDHVEETLSELRGENGSEGTSDGLSSGDRDDPRGATTRRADAASDVGGRFAALDHGAALEAGDDAAANGAWEEAAAAYRRATTADPDSAVAWYKLGVAEAIRGEPAGAAGAFERVRDIDPRWPGVDLLVARAQTRASEAADQDLVRDGFYEDDATRAAAEQDALSEENWALAVRARVELPPGLALGHRAERARYEGRLVDATELAIQALGASPTEIELHLLTADLYRLRGMARPARYFIDLYLALGGDEERARPVEAALERIAPRQSL